MRHLVAAAYEAPLEADDADTLGADFEQYAKRLVSAGELRERDGRYLPRKAGFPAAAISLRSASPDSFTVVDASEGELLGFVEAERAFSTVHPGAIYLHLGEPYEVDELDIAAQARDRAARRRRLLHAAEDRDRDLHRGDTRGARCARRGAAVRDRLRHPGGRRLPAQAALRSRGDRSPHARPAGAELRHAGALVRASRSSCSETCRWTCCSGRCMRPSTPRSPCCP